MTALAASIDSVSQPGPCRSGGPHAPEAREARPARGGALDREGSNLSPIEKRIAARKKRQAMRSTAAKLLPEHSVRFCAKHAGHGATLNGEKAVMVSKRQHGATFGNVMTCGSVWHCPVCAEKISHKRRELLSACIAEHRNVGGNVVMLTLTQGHRGFECPKHMAESMVQRFGRVVSGKAWQNMKEHQHVLGFVRALEVTHGGRGWHPHLHVLVFFTGEAGSAHLCYFLNWIVERWCRFTEKDGFKVNDTAQHYRMANDAGEAAEYVTKWGAEWEMTSGHIKSGKGGRTPFQILADATASNDQNDERLFVQYANAFKGRRQLQWSPILKKTYPDAFRNDNDLLDDEDVEDVAVITENAYQEIQKRGLGEEALQAASRGHLTFLSFMGGLGLMAEVFPPERAERRARSRRILREHLQRKRWNQKCSH